MKKILKPVDFMIIGSSIMNRWPNPIFDNYINLSVSGFKTHNIINKRYLYFISKFSPKYIIYYCGSNDINKNISVEVIIKNIIKFIKFIYTYYDPVPKIIFLSLLVSPQKISKNLQNQVMLLNQLIQIICLKFKNMIYVDINDIINHNDYLDDKNHLKLTGYDKINKKMYDIFFKNKS